MSGRKRIICYIILSHRSCTFLSKVRSIGLDSSQDGKSGTQFVPCLAGPNVGKYHLHRESQRELVVNTLCPLCKRCRVEFKVLHGFRGVKYSLFTINRWRCKATVPFTRVSISVQVEDPMCGGKCIIWWGLPSWRTEEITGPYGHTLSTILTIEQ
jgi:hypothetical protein